MYNLIGILIAGGFDTWNVLSVEVFVPETGLSCSLPNMTISRSDFTLNGFLACGGDVISSASSGSRNCSLYNPRDQGWTLEAYQLSQWRGSHSSWTLTNGSVLLMGGSGDYLVNETDPWDMVHGITTELVTAGVGSVPSFNLKYQSE